MSRRKQSHPKPLLKREDEGWGSDGDPGATAAALAADQNGAHGSPGSPGVAASPKEARSDGSPVHVHDDGGSPEGAPDSRGATPDGGLSSPGEGGGGSGGTTAQVSPPLSSPKREPRSPASRSPSPEKESPRTVAASPRSSPPARGPKVVDLVEDADKDRPSDSTTVSERPAAAKPDRERTPATGGPGPRLRLNPSLATDPAAGAATLPSGGARRDFLAALPPAFHSAAALAVTRGLYLPRAAEAVAALLPGGVSTSSTGALATPSSQPHAPAEQAEARQAVAFRCEPCGIRFSSLSTLEAHQTYYCSHRPNAQGPKGPIVEADENPAGADNGDRADSADGSEPSKRPGAGSVTPAGGASGGSGSLNQPSTKQYSCPHCSYSADKKVSLNRHMRMHTASPTAATGAVAPPLPLPLQLQVQPADPADAASSFVDRYCQDCDIRFSSHKTFRAHKLHYCSTRHVLKSTVGAGSSESASPSPVDGAPGSGPALPTRAAAGSPGHASSNEALLALPTNPPLLVPYSLVQAANVVQGAALSSALGANAALSAALGATCLLWMPDGSLQPVAHANLPLPSPSPSRPRPPTAASQPAPSPSPHQQPQTTGPAVPRRHRDAKQTSPTPRAGRSASTALGPLDLSVRRASDCSEDDIDEDVHVHEHEHEDIVCAPSIPLMLSASSACSSPSPAPPHHSPSPPPQQASRKRPLSPAHSPTDRGGKKSPRRTPNGVVVTGVLKKEVPEVSPVGVSRSPITTPGPDPQLLLQSVLAGRGLLLSNSLGSPLELALRMAAVSAVSAAELQQQVAPPPPPPPQVHVKHGVSKCKECDIVFNRHENFLAHKRHYCQARLQEDAQATSAEASNAPSPGAAVTSRSPSANSPSEPQILAAPAAPAPPTTTHVQYICGWCNIKFTSLDNLSHHQAYYCPKRPQDASTGPVGASLPLPGKVADDKARRRCPKCKASVLAEHAASHQCEVMMGSGWKCPCCPVTSPTISAAQRHMESHSGIKAFRCTVCGYKGNTLRGMRTHIRTHAIADAQEENYISCVMEDDAALPALVPVPTPLATPPTPPVAPLTVATDVSSLPGAAPESERERERERQFSCDLCSYSTNHRSNILHHVKHVHGRSLEEAVSSVSNPSRTLDDQRSSVSMNGADRITIKEEKLDEDYIAIEDLKVKEEPAFSSDIEERSSLPIRASPVSIEDSKSALKSVEDLRRGDEAMSANNNKTGPKYCKSCDISFTLYDNFMTHKKFYCSRSEPDGKVAQASAL